MAKAIASDGYNMVIYEIENGIDDYVIWGYADEKKQRRSKIYYTQSSGRAYFKVNGSRRYLDSFMRTNYPGF